MARLSASQFPFLAELSRTGGLEVANLAVTRVARFHPLLTRGDPVDGAYLLVGGALRIYYVTAEGRQATLYRVEPGGTCVLAVTAAFAGEAYPAWAEAGPDGAAFARVPNPVFRRLFDHEAGFRNFIFGALSRRVLELMQILEETGSAQIEQRVARLLLRQADAEGLVRVSQRQIAAEIGTAREVVFRALRSLSERGLVETGRVRVRVLDAGGLRRAGDLNPPAQRVRGRVP